jgi:hypothetical protein
MIGQKNLGDSSLAFVDVITNGLGGLLVMFFIVVLIQNNLEWSGNSGSATAVKTDEFPFVIIVRPLEGDDTTCFDVVADVWSINGLPPGVVDETRGKNIDWGGDYAMFVAPVPLLPTQTTLSVRTTRDAKLSVEVYPAGARQRTFQVDALASQLTEVWPRLGETTK